MFDKTYPVNLLELFTVAPFLVIFVITTAVVSSGLHQFCFYPGDLRRNLILYLFVKRDKQQQQDSLASKFGLTLQILHAKKWIKNIGSGIVNVSSIPIPEAVEVVQTITEHRQNKCPEIK